jgi:hypothetical protein
MAAGFAVNGVCHATAANALSAFRAEFPQVSGGALSYLNSSSITGSAITYSIGTKPATSNNVVTRTGTLNLSSCETVSDVMTANMAGLALAMLMAFFTAFFLRKAVRIFAGFGGGFRNDF